MAKKSAPKQEAPATPAAPEKEKPTYITVRFADKVLTKDGQETSVKRVTNLFYNGGLDKTGNPVFNNDKSIAFVRDGNISIYKTDKEGKIAVDKDGHQVAPVRRNLDAFVAGNAQGLESKSLNPGEATISGPKAAEVVEKFKAAIQAAEIKKASVEHHEDGPGMG